MRAQIMGSRCSHLVLGLALFGCGLFTSHPATAQDNAEAWLLEFTSGTTVHEGLLMLKEGAGWLRVRYYSPERGRTEIVEMPISEQNTSRGVLLVSGRAVDIETGRVHPAYAPDNFLIRTYPDGQTQVVNIDDNGVLSATTVTNISDRSAFIRVARAFKVFRR